ncbi:hypothetical protein LXL04_021425 [Taraxacum kok-saghyz]
MFEGGRNRCQFSADHALPPISTTYSRAKIKLKTPLCSPHLRDQNPPINFTFRRKSFGPPAAVTVKTSVVCGPHLQPCAGEEVDQTSAVCKKKTGKIEAKSELGGAEQAKSEHGGAEQAKSELGGGEQRRNRRRKGCCRGSQSPVEKERLLRCSTGESSSGEYLMRSRDGEGRIHESDYPSNARNPAAYVKSTLATFYRKPDAFTPLHRGVQKPDAFTPLHLKFWNGSSSGTLLALHLPQDAASEILEAIHVAFCARPCCRPPSIRATGGATQPALRPPERRSTPHPTPAQPSDIQHLKV